MKRIAALIACSLLLLIVLMPDCASAAIYKYTSEEGIPCFTDDLHSIPESCRASAVLVEPDEPVRAWEQAGPESEGAGEDSVSAQADHALPLAKPGWYDIRFTYRLLITAGGFCLFVLLRAALPWLRDFPNIDKILPVLHYTLAVCLCIYVVLAHFRDVIQVYTTVSAKIEDTKRKSAERGKRAAEAIKAMNEFMAEIDQAPGDARKGND